MCIRDSLEAAVGLLLDGEVEDDAAVLVLSALVGDEVAHGVDHERASDGAVRGGSGDVFAGLHHVRMAAHDDVHAGRDQLLGVLFRQGLGHALVLLSLIHI